MNFKDYLEDIASGVLRQTDYSKPGWLASTSRKFAEESNPNHSLEIPSRFLSIFEHRDAIERVVSTLTSDNVSKSGVHRLPAWTLGWQENLEAFKLNPSKAALVPGYFRPFSVQQYMGRWMKSETELGFELDFLHSLINVVVHGVRYEFSFDTLIEFGCGTGHNLVSISEAFPSINLVGCDWAVSSQEILQEIATQLKINVLGRHFDYFSPSLEVEPEFCALTVASMEQLGEDHNKFLDFLISKSPVCVVHFEPIGELLPSDELLGNISLEYFRKRNYLSGYLTKLIELEKRKKVEIIAAERTGFGSFFIEGYSLVIWKPIKAKG